MSTYRGSRGLLALGGLQSGNPQLKGAVAQGASQATIDGGGSALTGAILEGDEFTVAGDATTYTVTADARIGENVANEVTVSFEPTVQVSGGWADNAAVSFVANSIAQVRRWEAEANRPYLRDDTMGDDARTGKLDTPQWTGSAEGLLDLADAEQKAVVDAVRQNNPAPDFGAYLQVGSGPMKGFYGHLQPVNSRINGERGSLVIVEFDFEGEGLLAPDWNT